MGWIRNEDVKEQRRTQAKRDFREASTLAAQNGLRFSHINDVQYQLRGKTFGVSWLINVYPGNCRLYHDPQKTAPFLEISSEWGLLDVVQSAITAVDTLQQKEQSMRNWQQGILVHSESIPGPDDSVCDVEIKTGAEPGMFAITYGEGDEGMILSLAELKRITQKAGEYHKAAVKS